MNYKAIDPIVQAVSGALTALAVWFIVSPGWNMWTGMLVGGICGMVLMFVAMFPMMAVLGSFEVMIPMTLTNMTAGMIAGMSLPLRSPPAGCLALTGAAIGLIVYAIVWTSNRRLTGF